MTTGEAAAPAWEAYKQDQGYANLFHSVYRCCAEYYSNSDSAREKADEFIYTAFIQGYIAGSSGN